MRQITVNPEKGLLEVKPEGSPNILSLTLETLERFRNVLKAENSYKLLVYALKKRAFTSRIVEAETNLPESSFFRSLKTLMDNGFVVEAMKVPSPPPGMRGKGGPRSSIYALSGYDPEDLIKAGVQHNKLLNPRYVEATRVTQLIMEDYIDIDSPRKEINYHQIMEVLKSRLRRVDVGMADLVAICLGENDVKVWR